MPISPQEAQRITLETYNATAQWYAETHSDITEMKIQIDIFISLLAGKNVLDIGCGPGRDAKYFVEHGYAVTGIDMSEKLLDIAKEQVPNATFLLADMRALPFCSPTFDGIRSCASLLHVPKADVPATLQWRYNVLQPGGIVFIGVKAGSGEHMVRKDYYEGHEKFFAFYELPELTNFITDAGFEIIQTDMDAKRDARCNVFARKG
jgi:SAM-dependent methyltransferase